MESLHPVLTRSLCVMCRQGNEEMITYEALHSLCYADMELTVRLELTTCSLRVSCSTN